MKSNAQNTNDKVLVLIFAVVFIVLLAAAYLIGSQPNMAYWAILPCSLAALVFVDLRWLMRASVGGD